MVWKNVEIIKGESDDFKRFLRENAIKFETSECGKYVHFECLVTEQQTDMCNDFLNTL